MAVLEVDLERAGSQEASVACHMVQTDEPLEQLDRHTRQVGRDCAPVVKQAALQVSKASWDVRFASFRTWGLETACYPGRLVLRPDSTWDREEMTVHAQDPSRRQTRCE